MLIIREEQMSAFSQAMLKQFEDHMIVHLNNNFPDETREISDGELRDLIQEGIEKAERYQITLEDDVERYLDLMFFLSFDFDVNSQTSWAGEILQKDWEAEIKLDVLYTKYKVRIKGD